MTSAPRSRGRTPQPCLFCAGDDAGHYDNLHRELGCRHGDRLSVEAEDAREQDIFVD